MTDDDIYRWLNDTEPSPKDDPSRVETGELEAIYLTPGEPRSGFGHDDYHATGISDWAQEKEYSEKAGRMFLSIAALILGAVAVAGLAVAIVWSWGQR